MSLNRKVLGYLISVILLCSAAVVIRYFLVDMGMLTDAGLEMLTASIQEGSVTVEEAITAFCREILLDGIS